MSEFSRILELYEELARTVQLQQIQINQLRILAAQQAQTSQIKPKKQEAA
ncbi:hypothetical protein [Microbulbifer variabilis]|nr:hypothetical protein [Microbulbifer variabilis]